MGSTGYAISGGVVMTIVLLIGTVQAWRRWRDDPGDALRSDRLKHLSVAILGAWLVLTAAFFLLGGTRLAPDGVGDLALSLALALPAASIAVWALGHRAHTTEQREAREVDQSLGLVVPPKRRSPTTLALLYTLGYFTALPALLILTLLGIISTFRNRVDEDGGEIAVTTVAVLGGAYLALAITHIALRWWRIRREAEQARRANLGQVDPGSSAANESV